MEREIQKEDLRGEKGDTERKWEQRKGSGDWKDWKAKNFVDCVSWGGAMDHWVIDVLDWDNGDLWLMLNIGQKCQNGYTGTSS